VVVPKNSDVPVAGADGATWQDVIGRLKGKTISDNGPGSPIDQEVQAYFTEAGLSKTSYTAVASGEGAAAAAALQSGAVDAVVQNPVVANQLVASGVAKAVINMETQGPPLVSNQAFIGWASTQKFLTAHPDFAEKFLAALTQAENFIHDPANLSAVTKIAVAGKEVTDGPSSEAAVRSIIRDYSLTFTKAQLQNAIDFATSTGTDSAALTPADISVPSAVS
jgi:ABC-type nitrate/sulfonate/bicarbonate transport system substrate-binding protein